MDAKTETLCTTFHFTHLEYEALDVCWSEIPIKLSERLNLKLVVPLFNFFRCTVRYTANVWSKNKATLTLMFFHWMQLNPAYLNWEDFERLAVQTQANPASYC